MFLGKEKLSKINWNNVGIVFLSIASIVGWIFTICHICASAESFKWPAVAIVSSSFMLGLGSIMLEIKLQHDGIRNKIKKKILNKE